jgi:hypothetical protein
MPTAAATNLRLQAQIFVKLLIAPAGPPTLAFRRREGPTKSRVSAMMYTEPEWSEEERVVR